jgi:hypothetical protein
LGIIKETSGIIAALVVIRHLVYKLNSGATSMLIATETLIEIFDKMDDYLWQEVVVSGLIELLQSYIEAKPDEDEEDFIPWSWDTDHVDIVECNEACTGLNQLKNSFEKCRELFKPYLSESDYELIEFDTIEEDAIFESDYISDALYDVDDWIKNYDTSEEQAKAFISTCLNYIMSSYVYAIAEELSEDEDDGTFEEIVDQLRSY